jgi:hypothetical protein
MEVDDQSHPATSSAGLQSCGDGLLYVRIGPMSRPSTDSFCSAFGPHNFKSVGYQSTPCSGSVREYPQLQRIAWVDG